MHNSAMADINGSYRREEISRLLERLVATSWL